MANAKVAPLVESGHAARVVRAAFYHDRCEHLSNRRESHDARGRHSLIDDHIQAGRLEPETANEQSRRTATDGGEADLTAVIGHATDCCAVNSQLGTRDRSAE
jgi:hypothetical protein